MQMACDLYCSSYLLSLLSIEIKDAKITRLAINKINFEVVISHSILLDVLVTNVQYVEESVRH